MATGTTLPETEATRTLREAQEKASQTTTPPPPAPQVVEKVVEKIVYPDNVQALIERTRQEEKDKLYDRVKRAEAVENENIALRARVTDLEKSIAQMAESTKQPEKSSRSGKEAKDTLDAEFVKAIMEDTAAAVRDQFKVELAERDERIAALQQANAKTALQAHREKLIQDARGRIIPAMVTGSTVQELEVAAIQAMSEYERIVKSVGGQPLPNSSIASAGAPSAAYPQVPSATGSQPAAPPALGAVQPTSPLADGTSARSEEQRLAEEVSQMSPADYAKNRAAIRAKTRRLFANVQNPALGR